MEWVLSVPVQPFIYVGKSSWYSMYVVMCSIYAIQFVLIVDFDVSLVVASPHCSSQFERSERFDLIWFDLIRFGKVDDKCVCVCVCVLTKSIWFLNRFDSTTHCWISLLFILFFSSSLANAHAHRWMKVNEIGRGRCVGFGVWFFFRSRSIDYDFRLCRQFVLSTFESNRLWWCDGVMYDVWCMIYEYAKCVKFFRTTIPFHSI